MTVNPYMLRALCYYFRREAISEVWIFQKDYCESIINFQLGYLSLEKDMNLVWIIDGKRYYVNYEDLIFSIKSSSIIYFFSDQLYLPRNRKGFVDGILPQLVLIVIQVDLNIAESEKKHCKAISMLISISKMVSSKTQNFPSLPSTWNKAMIIFDSSSLQP